MQSMMVSLLGPEQDGKEWSTHRESHMDNTQASEYKLILFSQIGKIMALRGCYLGL